METLTLFYGKQAPPGKSLHSTVDTAILSKLLRSTTAHEYTVCHPLNETPVSNLSSAYRWSKDLTSVQGVGASFEGTTVTIVTGTPVERLLIDIEVTEE